MQRSYIFGLRRFYIEQHALRLRVCNVSSDSGAPENNPKHKVKTPAGKLDDHFEINIDKKHPYAEKEPLPPWPSNTNPHTGEKNGPRGPEPTRYGDWERKGRVSDF